MEINKTYYTPLILLILIFFIPMASSWFLYHHAKWFPLKTLQHGVLIKPPVNIKSFLPESSQKKWDVIYVSSDICDQECKKINADLHQVQKALGNDRDRIVVMHLKNSEVHWPFDKTSFIFVKKIFLIDPLGNLFLYYPASTDPMNIFHDLKRLLEVSQIG